ncbi:ABC transporter permease [Tessaracoccus sp. HDW20]|uniref:ABC transporter permease n=1 Tax=Tessaracoccus coleopterorum TaxID=2714950 RepID=UPI0018D4383F|nr:ABC transporter permease [Tessaracoccus coleopterorum]NHB85115.1 ABC transporter permease [Tessaracoccus coleopterorum]
MLRFILKRSLVSVAVLLVISVLLFILVRQAPGDPVDMYVNPLTFSGDLEAARAAVTAQLGLDQPLVVQYFRWLGEALTGNLGYSYLDGRAVTALMMDRLYNTMALVVPSLIVSLLIGIVGGVWAALRHNRAGDYILSAGSVIALSVPPFFLALAGIYVFGLQLRWLPTAGMNATIPSAWEGFRHMIMPALILGTAGAAAYQRWTRSSMLDVLGQDFMMTARSKGLSGGRITWRHGVYNALIPIITVIAMNIPQLLGGAVIVEQVFAWPGMGRLAVDSITSRDYPVLMGFVMFIAIIVVIANLVADIAYSVVDPRIRL